MQFFSITLEDGDSANIYRYTRHHITENLNSNQQRCEFLRLRVFAPWRIRASINT